MQIMFLKIRNIIGIVFAMIVFLHPLFIYIGLKMYSSRIIASFVGVSIIGHFLMQDRHVYHMRLLIPFFAIMVMCMAAILLNNSIFILYLPCFISASLLASFSYSLLYPPNTVEMFA